MGKKRRRLPSPIQPSRSILLLGADILRLLASFLPVKELERFPIVCRGTQSILLHASGWPIWKAALVNAIDDWVLKRQDLQNSPVRARKLLRLQTGTKCELCLSRRKSKSYWQFQKRLCAQCFAQNTFTSSELKCNHGLDEDRLSHLAVEYHYIPEIPRHGDWYWICMGFYWRSSVKKYLGRPLEQFALERERARRQIPTLSAEHAFAPWTYPSTQGGNHRAKWIENPRSRCQWCRAQWCDDEHRGCRPPEHKVTYGSVVLDGAYKQALFRAWPTYSVEEIVDSWFGYNEHFPSGTEWSALGYDLNERQIRPSEIAARVPWVWQPHERHRPKWRVDGRTLPARLRSMAFR